MFMSRMMSIRSRCEQTIASTSKALKSSPKSSPKAAAATSTKSSPKSASKCVHHESSATDRDSESNNGDNDDVDVDDCDDSRLDALCPCCGWLRQRRHNIYYLCDALVWASVFDDIGAECVVGGRGYACTRSRRHALNLAGT